MRRDVTLTSAGITAPAYKRPRGGIDPRGRHEGNLSMRGGSGARLFSRHDRSKRITKAVTVFSEAQAVAWRRAALPARSLMQRATLAASNGLTTTASTSPEA